MEYSFDMPLPDECFMLNWQLITIIGENTDNIVTHKGKDISDPVEIYLGGRVRGYDPDRSVDILITNIVDKRFGDITTIDIGNEFFIMYEDGVIEIGNPLQYLPAEEILSLEFWVSRANYKKDHTHRLVTELVVQP